MGTTIHNNKAKTHGVSHSKSFFLYIHQKWFPVALWGRVAKHVLNALTPSQHFVAFPVLQFLLFYILTSMVEEITPTVAFIDDSA